MTQEAWPAADLELSIPSDQQGQQGVFGCKPAGEAGRRHIFKKSRAILIGPENIHTLSELVEAAGELGIRRLCLICSE